MPKQPSRKKTAVRRTEGVGRPEAVFPFFNGIVAGYEKWARETLAGKTGPFKRESDEWFADSIIRRIAKIYFLLYETTKDRTTKEAYKGQAVDRATWEAFHLGGIVHWLRTEIHGIGAERDKNILFGVKARVANLIRRKKQEAKAAPKTAALHEKIKARAAELRMKSKRSKALLLAREFPLSAHRIERII